jgi:pilus assembly protein Flp/PilA
MSANVNVGRQQIRNLRRRRGQGMTEYIVIVGLIGMLCIGAVRTFGGSLSNSFGAASNRIDNDITKAINGK